VKQQVAGMTSFVDQMFEMVRIFLQGFSWFGLDEVAGDLHAWADVVSLLS